MPGDKLAEAVQRLPATWHGHYFDAVASTQEWARTAAREGAPTRSIFVADCQRAGRGRLDRQWLAAPGSALLVSMLFREVSELDAFRPWRYTSLVSLALLQAMACRLPAAAIAIKWPNDLMLDDKKVAGVLAETTWDSQTLQVIVGVGLNVSSAPPELSGATCLQTAADAPIDRGDLLLTFVSQLEALFAASSDAVYQRWQSRLWRRGQRLRLLDGGQQDDVVVLGANPDGSLHVRGSDGRERWTVTGELLA
jgi:BirA family transcriptional regulator, biotin operon repressor / biotin---[acetyl-CoA-carboxylase] ligase